MKITIQKNRLKDKTQSSLYLSFSSPIENPFTGKSTRKHYLDITVYNEEVVDDHGVPVKAKLTVTQKRHNKDAWDAARLRCAEALKDIMNGKATFFGDNQADEGMTFADWYDDFAESHKNDGTKSIYRSVGKKIRAYDRKNTLLTKIDARWLEGFREFLLAGVAQNTASAHFTFVRAALNKAYRQDLITKRVTDKVDRIQTVDVDINHLSMDEVEALARTPCKIPELKRAALFAIHSGPRISDISNIRKRDFYQDSDHQWVLRHETKRGLKLQTPIPDVAMQHIDMSYDKDELQFPGLKRACYAPSGGGTTELKKWITAAGIDRRVTFHCFRHTYATQVLKHAQLVTVSKLLGHSQLQTTMRYAKVEMSNKVDAINKAFGSTPQDCAHPG